MNIQEALDNWLASNPQYQQYIAKLYYLQPNSEVPSDVTHILNFHSAISLERGVKVGIVVKMPYSILLEGILSAIGTLPKL